MNSFKYKKTKLLNSIHRLEEIKSDLYKDAVKSGVIENLGRVIRVLGKPYLIGISNFYRFTTDDFYCLYNDRDSSFEIRFNQRVVCSTRAGRKLFVPGFWVDKILNLLPEAKKIERERECEKLEERLACLKEELHCD